MKKKSSNPVVVDPTGEVSTEILATSIRDIAAGVAKLESGALNRRAILALIKESSGVSKVQIHRVLTCLANLEKDFCK